MVSSGWRNGFFGVEKWFLWGGEMVSLGWRNGFFVVEKWFLRG